MPNDPAIELSRSAEKLALDACAKEPKRLKDIIAAIRANPELANMRDPEIITVLCKLADTGKIASRTIEGYWHYATPDAWSKVNPARKPER
jgi:hypothetical protein